MLQPRYSIIVPVYNRPQEVEELLESLVLQSYQNFEVILVEDGSTLTSQQVAEKFQHQLTLHYLFKSNSGPGPSRNFGFQHARGEYFVIFDSDCIIPPDYFQAVEEGLRTHKLDAWGGPDRAHQDFTILQRAMGYTMASVLTTGGIRGGKKSVGWFQPRSFNMGLSRKVFERTNGFLFDRYAEDIEFSIRMKQEGFKVGLIPDAFVYHKRRTTFGQFFKQVFNFGKGRALIGKKYPEEVKLTHWIPTLFTAGVIVVFLLPLISRTFFLIGAAGVLFYFTAIFLHSLFVNKNLLVALLSVPSALLQFFGYGFGFLKERLKSYFR
jgi:glycosyltransferase involved in cell wall biosynthesis